MYKLEQATQEQHNLSFMWAYKILGIMFEKGIIAKTEKNNKTALGIRGNIEHAVYKALPRGTLNHYIGFHHVEVALRAYGVEMEKAEKLQYKSMKLKIKKRFDISEEIIRLHEELGVIH